MSSKNGEKFIVPLTKNRRFIRGVRCHLSQLTTLSRIRFLIVFMSNTTLPQDPTESAKRPSSRGKTTFETISIENRLDGSKDFFARIDVLRQQAREDLTLPDADSIEQPKMLGFCATFFLFGQIVSLWALVNGHVAPMVIGLLFSLTGACFGIGSLLNRRPVIETIDPVVAAEQPVDGKQGFEKHRIIA